MKIFIMVFILCSFLSAKECYFNKVNNICYYKYFKKSNIDKAKANEEYYSNKKGQIYTFDKIIEVKFNSIGAVFVVLNDFELEFVDKIKKEVYLFKVEDRRDLFPTISKLNRLKTIMKAQPHSVRKYTKAHVQRLLEQKRARFEAVMEKAQDRLESKSRPNTKEKRNVGFNLPDGEEGTKEKKSFLKGNAQ